MIKWILPLLWSSTVFAQGFLNGNEFTAYELRGNLFLTCYGQNQTVTVRKRCEQSTLLPVVSDYFATEEKINGDRVRLKNISDKGNNFDRTVFYNKKKQRTHRRVKLWAKYWDEREGLLNMGENLIAYEFQNKNKELLLNGQIEVNVQDGGGRLCQDGRDYSYNLNDCYNSDARNFCERYFEWNNYCD